MLTYLLNFCSFLCRPSVTILVLLPFVCLNTTHKECNFDVFLISVLEKTAFSVQQSSQTGCRNQLVWRLVTWNSNQPHATLPSDKPATRAVQVAAQRHHRENINVTDKCQYPFSHTHTLQDGKNPCSSGLFPKTHHNASFFLQITAKYSILIIWLDHILSTRVFKTFTYSSCGIYCLCPCKSVIQSRTTLGSTGRWLVYYGMILSMFLA